MTDECEGHGKGGSIMNMPRLSAEASLYQSGNHYRSARGTSYAGSGAPAVTPQDCGFTQGIACGTLIAGGVVVCTASCLASPSLGGLPCYACWTAYLGGLYGFCRDCIPAWMRTVLDVFEGNGGDSGGGVPQCCPPGRTCRCGGRCVTNPNGTVSCVGGECLTPNQQCR
jgi:hypothetical protein